MRRNKRDSTNLNLCLCQCGCGEQIEPFDSRRRPRHFKNHHILKLKVYPKGSNHHSWKGGRKMINGYWAIKKPEHHFAHCNGYVHEHRLVWEEANKACLLPWADVHHIDGNEQNNDPSNLVAMTHSRHVRMELTGRKRAKETIQKMWESRRRNKEIKMSPYAAT